MTFSCLSPIFDSVDRVLDVGCGDGSLSLYLSSIFKQVYSIDVCEKAITEAKETLKECSNVKVIKMDVAKADFEDNYFDYVVFFRSLHFVNDVKTVFKEVERILKKKGKLVVITSPNFSLTSVQVEKDRLNSDIDNVFSQFCSEMFDQELKQYWNASTRNQFLMYCDPDRVRPEEHFPFPDFTTLNLTEESEINILDLTEAIGRFSVAKIYSEKHGKEALEEVVSDLQVQILTLLDLERCDMYFENVLLKRRDQFYVQINVKP